MINNATQQEEAEIEWRKNTAELDSTTQDTKKHRTKTDLKTWISNKMQVYTEDMVEFDTYRPRKPPKNQAQPQDGGKPQPEVGQEEINKLKEKVKTKKD